MSAIASISIIASSVPAALRVHQHLDTSIIASSVRQELDYKTRSNAPIQNNDDLAQVIYMTVVTTLYDSDLAMLYDSDLTLSKPRPNVCPFNALRMPQLDTPGRGMLHVHIVHGQRNR